MGHKRNEELHLGPQGRKNISWTFIA